MCEIQKEKIKVKGLFNLSQPSINSKYEFISSKSNEFELMQEDLLNFVNHNIKMKKFSGKQIKYFFNKFSSLSDRISIK